MVQIGTYQITRGQMIIFGAIIIIILLLSSVFLGILPGSRPSKPAAATLVFWGLYDDQAAWQPYFDAYTKDNPNIYFNYTRMNPDTYESDLVNALASGKAPDIIMFHSSWLPKHGNKISPLPPDLMTVRQYQDIFPDAANINFISQNKIYALPIWTDTLAMFYNKDLFNTAGIAAPPKTWDEFVKVVGKLSKKDKFGNLTKSGAALGTSDNINNAPDIVSLLMLQSGTKMISDDGTRANFDQPITLGGTTYKPGGSALRFYTDFSNPKSAAYTWNNLMPNYIDAFTSGQTAIIFDYAVNISRIKQKASNLQLGIAAVPQLAGASKFVNYANFWGYSVPLVSKHPTDAWKFLLFMTSQQVNSAFSQQVGRSGSRRDVIGTEQSSPDLGVFADSILSATDWYQADPDQISQIFKDMINSVVLSGAKPADAISDAANKVTLLMGKK